MDEHDIVMCGYTSEANANVKIQIKETNNTEKPNKYRQCDYSFSPAGDLRGHLKIHSGEKSTKCNQCEYTSSHAGALRRHLKTHS